MEDKTPSHYHQPKHHTTRWRTPSRLAVLFFFAAIGYLLLTEHWAHIKPYLPWLILLLCPLMHFFHHGGHHRHQDTHQDEQEH